MVQQQTTTSERIDELPLVIHCLKQMQVDVIIDRVLGPAHGNWEGLSRGELALVYVSYVVMSCTHFLSPMQAWVVGPLHSLSRSVCRWRRPPCRASRPMTRTTYRLGNVWRPRLAGPISWWWGTASWPAWRTAPTSRRTGEFT